MGYIFYFYEGLGDIGGFCLMIDTFWAYGVTMKRGFSRIERGFSLIIGAEGVEG